MTFRTFFFYYFLSFFSFRFKTILFRYVFLRRCNTQNIRYCVVNRRWHLTLVRIYAAIFSCQKHAISIHYSKRTALPTRICNKVLHFIILTTSLTDVSEFFDIWYSRECYSNGRKNHASSLKTPQIISSQRYEWCYQERMHFFTKNIKRINFIWFWNFLLFWKIISLRDMYLLENFRLVVL